MRQNVFLNVMKKFFCGRQDVFAERFEFSDNGQSRSGYRKVCRNRLVDGLCPKVQDKAFGCNSCIYSDNAILDDSWLLKHFDGRATIAVYPLLQDSTCGFIAADFDNKEGDLDPYSDVVKFTSQLKADGISSYPLRSRSGKGYHVYVFFEVTVPASKARLVMYNALDKGNIQLGKEGEANSTFDRFFPAQDELTASRQLGNAIALPFQGKPMELGHTLFLDPNTDYMEPLDHSNGNLLFETCTEALLDEIISKYGLNSQTLATLRGVPKKHVSFVLPDVINQGKRHDTLFRYTCSLQGKGFDDDDILAMLLDANTNRCSPPMDMDDVEDLHADVTSRYQKGNGNLPVVVNTAVLTTAKTLDRITDLLPSANVSPKAVCPHGYEIDMDTGVTKWEPKTSAKGKIEYRDINCLRVPALVSKRLKDNWTKEERIELTFYRDGRWQCVVAEADTFADARKSISLANASVPVDSVCSRYFVPYVTAYLITNQKAIPIVRTSSRLGWQKGQQSFLCGQSLVTADKIYTAEELATTNPEDGRAEEIVTFCDNQNEAASQVARGYVQSGEFGRWIKTINKALKYRVPMMMFISSCATPFLAILGAPNYVIESSGKTSTGKTTLLHMVASTWGNPKEIVFNWNATITFIERVCAMLDGLPLYLDDTKLLTALGSQDEASRLVTAVIYAIANGQGRGRGTPTGFQPTSVFRSVLLSTGEQPCNDFSSGHGGAQARVIPLFEDPFQGGNIDLVTEIRNTVSANYGHLGVLLVQHILKNRNIWDDWKARYKAIVSEYQMLAENNSVAYRISENYALMEFVASVVMEAFSDIDLGTYRECLRKSFVEISSESVDSSNNALRALKLTYDYAVSHQAKFYQPNNDNIETRVYEPSNGWIGAWYDDKIAFIGSKLIKYLTDNCTENGTAIIKLWKSEGWLMLSSDQRHQRTVKIKGKPCSCYCIKQQTFIDVLKLSDFGDAISEDETSVESGEEFSSWESMDVFNEPDNAVEKGIQKQQEIAHDDDLWNLAFLTAQ